MRWGYKFRRWWLVLLVVAVGLFGGVASAAPAQLTYSLRSSMTIHTGTPGVTELDGNTATTLDLTADGSDYYIKYNLPTTTYDLHKVRVYLAAVSPGTLKIRATKADGSTMVVKPTTATAGSPAGWYEVDYAGYPAATISVLFAGAVRYSVGEIVADAATTAPPGPVYGLVADGSNARVVLNWSAPGTGADGYKVLRDGVLVSDVGVSRTYTDTTVTPDVSYRYTVVAYNVLGDSAGTDVQVTVKPSPPGVPVQVQASAGDGQVVLTWAAGPGGAPTSYRIWRDGVEQSITSDMTATVTGLVNGTTYSFTVQAINAIAASGQSAAVTATPRIDPITVAPTAKVDSKGGSYVTVSWAAVPGAAGYVLTQDGLEVARVQATSYTFSGLSTETAYSFGVSAYNSMGSGPEAPLSATTGKIDWTDMGHTATDGGVGLANAADSAFTKMWPYIVGLIALVFLAFWVIGRTKKGAIGAK